MYFYIILNVNIIKAFGFWREEPHLGAAGRLWLVAPGCPSELGGDVARCKVLSSEQGAQSVKGPLTECERRASGAVVGLLVRSSGVTFQSPTKIFSSTNSSSSSASASSIRTIWCWEIYGSGFVSSTLHQVAQRSLHLHSHKDQSFHRNFSFSQRFCWSFGILGPNSLRSPVFCRSPFIDRRTLLFKPVLLLLLALPLLCSCSWSNSDVITGYSCLDFLRLC